MNRRTQTSIKIHLMGIAVTLLLLACGGGEGTSGEGSSLAVTTPVSPVSVQALEPESSSPVAEVNIAPVASISATPSSGQTSLQVNFIAADASSNSTAIVSYSWDFGDGNTASGENVTHSYDIANTYTARLTLTDANGETDSSTRQIYVFGSSVDNSQAIVPNSVYFYDDFNYRVQRSGDSLSQFQAHGWSGGKAENLPAGSGKGYIYTTSSIPGYSGPFPGKDSTRVLALEGRPSSFGIQTDFYLQFGGDFDDQIPADVWFQYWMYNNYYDDPTDQNDQMSRFGPHPKFIYPTKGGYPSNNGLWILYSSNNSKAPYSNDLGQNSSEFYFYLADMEDISYLQTNGSSSWKIGQTDISDHIVPNRWTLVKIHIDTSTVNPRYEQWMKPMGGQWLKVAEQIQGQTPNLNWQIEPQNVGGHRSFRMPTTQNPCRFAGDPNLSCDSWMYLDDFTIATSEDTLPVYPY